MGRFSVEIRCVTGAGEILRRKKDSTCDLSFCHYKRRGTIPQSKKIQVTCQEKRWREKVRVEQKTQAETVWEGREAELDLGEIR